MNDFEVKTAGTVRDLRMGDIDNLCFTKQTTGSAQNTMLGKEDKECTI